jgi:23S rRNA (uracil1939-C5)-methyltransferase
MPENPETHDIQLTTLVYGGEALGRLPDRRAVFVPLALPGEIVRIRLVEEKRSHARAELLEVLEPSPERISPRCTHFGLCGGCHYQHMPYKAQLEAKSAILRDQLERIGRLREPPVLSAVPSPLPFNYRNYVQFHLTSLGRLGFHTILGDNLFTLEECHLPEATINTVWPQLDFESIPDLERIGLRLGADEDLQLILEGNDPQPPDFSVEELPLSAVHLSPAGSLVLAGSEYVLIDILDRTFRVSAASFFQVNTCMAEAMVSHVQNHLEKFQTLGPNSTILDVYCGVGLFSAFLAPKAGRLIGIESSPSAVEDFVSNLDEFENVEVYEDTAEAVLPQLNLHPDLILVDPPRAGLDRRALDGILALAPETLVYISCDPATLSRDARRLTAGGYQLLQVTPFDLFPQTYHIESISFWQPDR